MNLITVVVVLVVIGLINMVIRRTIINPLKQVTVHLQQISGGDLTSEDTLIANQDEIGLLARTVNDTNRTLLEIVSQIRSVSSIIARQGRSWSAIFPIQRRAASRLPLLWRSWPKLLEARRRQP